MELIFNPYVEFRRVQLAKSTLVTSTMGHSSQHVCLDVCTTQEQNAQNTIRKEWWGGRFGERWLVDDEALEGMV